MAVSLRLRDSITQRLARRSLVLLPRVRVGWAACIALLIAAQLLAAAAAWWYWQQLQASVQAQEKVHERAASAAQRQLEQSRLQQRLSASHSQELERQIDALHRQLRESQEELGFLRQARIAKR